MMSRSLAGVVALATVRECRRRVAECASCERVRPLISRGLCDTCRARHQENGTIGEYGYVKADRMADFARLRSSGYGVGEAARRIGVSERTGERYEAELKNATRSAA